MSQLNGEMCIRDSSNTDVMNSRNPQLRLFTVTRASSFTPKTDVAGTWQEAVPATVREFSATSYYFGRMIQPQLNIPVGLIVASWGGSACEAVSYTHLDVYKRQVWGHSMHRKNLCLSLTEYR